MAIIIIRTLVVYFALVVSMRLMGKRQLSELELPELAIAVLIADLAAHPLQDIGIPLMNGLLPIVVLCCCELLISGAALRHAGLRTLLFGRPSFLIRRGKIDQKEMRRCRLNLEELYEELRAQNVTDAAQVEYAVLETDGTLSVILYPEFRPATVRDLGLTPRDTGYPVIVINDGKLMRENLRLTGRDEAWLRKELKKRGASGLTETLELSRAYCEAGRFELAESELEKTSDAWLAADGYTHIFIRHSEIDSTTDAFFELMSDVRSEDAQSAAGSYEKLLAHLSSLYTMERVTLGSIF